MGGGRDIRYKTAEYSCISPGSGLFMEEVWWKKSADK